MIGLLIVPLLFCQGQNIKYNENTGKVEITPDKAIDLSKIVSDWERQSDTINSLQEKLDRSKELLEEYSILNRNLAKEILTLNEGQRNASLNLDEITGRITDYYKKESRGLHLFGVFQTRAFEFQEFDISLKLELSTKYISIFARPSLTNINTVELENTSVGINYWLGIQYKIF